MADQIEEMMQIGKKEKKNKKRKRTKGKWGKKREGKRKRRGKEKERRWGLNILKNYRVTMKIRNS